MLVDAALGFVNRLLTIEVWARDRLKPFAGKTARLELGALCVSVMITDDGLFINTDSDAPPEVVLSLPLDALPRGLADRSHLFAAAKISGAADLAETLGFVFRNLSWDAEGDLALLVGDIAARRLFQGGQIALDWQKRQFGNLARNLAEYFTEENPTIAQRMEIAVYCVETAKLGDTLGKLEQRVARLEAHSS